MGIFKSTRGIASRIIDIRVDKWLSLDYLTETTNRYKILLKDSVVPQKATYSETFEEAMERMNLTEIDLVQRKKEFTQLFYAFLGLSVGIILYALYMAFKGSMISSLISFCLCLYTLAQAFRFHFWLFQLENRKLGCTFKEYLNSKVIAEPPTHSLVVKETSSAVKHSHKRKGKE